MARPMALAQGKCSCCRNVAVSGGRNRAHLPTSAAEIRFIPIIFESSGQKSGNILQRRMH